MTPKNKQNRQKEKVMNNTNENKTSDIYLAHVDFETGRTQSFQEHTDNVTSYAKSICPMEEIQKLVEAAALFHDAGKLSDDVQKDFQDILKKGDQAHRNDLDHSTAGGRMLWKMMRQKTAAELLSTVVYSHHGISDCIDFESGCTLQERRAEKECQEDIVKERFFQIFDKEKIQKVCEAADAQYVQINKKIGMFVRKSTKQNRHCGNGYFYIGMYFRVLLSMLLDSDWTDTEKFFQNEELKQRISKKEIQKIWQQSIQCFENYLNHEIRNKAENGQSLQAVRQEISERCYEEAEKETRLYRLTVPTGAGKTLSSLRFALYRAERTQKQHIIYVAPFNSILSQNADEIRRAVDDPDIVLEHHCNVILSEGKQEKDYKKLTETWDVPIIMTSAVQVLNVLFSGQKRDIRRMHTLCNSVIIFDEVQAIPKKCMELFNLAVNFLTNFAESDVVLCSATQPSIKDLKENNLSECMEMTGIIEKYEETFRRTDIVDLTETEAYPGGMEIEDLCDFTLQQAETFRNVLVIVNTTECAKQVYEKIKSSCSDEDQVFHLSNKLCPQNKEDTLETVHAALRKNRESGYTGRVICISTPVVEAGVNFSFGCVIRSKAGLDHVIQAAGRGNRHKEYPWFGKIYIVQLTNEAESLEKLPEIQEEQRAVQKLLEQFRSKPEIFEKRLDSSKAIAIYYQYYYQVLQADITKFPAKNYKTTLLEMLGKNCPGRKQYWHKFEQEYKGGMAQAFATAGKEFEVISNDYKIPVVIPYNDEAKKLIAAFVGADGEYLPWEEKQRILRELQKYTVGISEVQKERLNNAIYQISDEEILVLSEGYYSNEVGVLEEPQMNFENY